uniref:fatty acyl-AMP ligase n=1 Tax=Calothrix rhizosoleniae TaxID=888997 RepID=UPI001F27A166
MYKTINVLEKNNSNITNLVNLVRHRNQNQADNIAFTFLANGETEEASLTYQELDKKARAIAAVLQSMKVSGERALLLYQPGLEFIAAFFGCLYAGVIAVPVYPPRRNHHSNRLQAIVSDAQATIALTTASVFSNIEKTLKSEPELAILRCITTDEIDHNKANGWQPPYIENDTLAFLQYTSGSTGTPKGVMVSHGNLMHNSQIIYQCFGHTAKSQGVIWLPLYHDMGLIGGILQPLYGSFPVTLMSPTAFVKKPYRWLQAISHYQATTSGGPNFAYDLCVRQITPEQRATLDLSSWDVAFTGAEPIRAQTLERFATTFADCGFRREAFYPCYGMAETTLIVSGGVKAEPPIIHHVNGSELEQKRVMETTGQQEGDKAVVGCGKTWLDHKIVIVDPKSLTPCPSGKVGEIWVSGSSVASGYWNQPEQTQQTFYNYLADTDERPFLRTGDLGFLHNGELFVTSRLKDLIIISGRNHSPQDIEYTVEQCHHALRPNC